MDATGGFLVTWDGIDGGSPGIFGQFFDSTGAMIGTEFQINTYTTGTQYDPSLAMDPGGGFIVSWTSLGQDGAAGGIFARQFDSAGAAVGTEMQVNTYTTGVQASSSAAFETDGGFIVVFHAADHGLVGNNILAQRFQSSGAPRGTEFIVNTFTTSYQSFPAVAAEAGGDFVVVWASNPQDGSNDGVFGQRFDSSGLPIGADFQVNTYTVNFQTVPSIVTDAAGTFVVTWTDASDGNGRGVFLQRFEGGGPTYTPVPPTATPTETVTVTQTVTATSTPAVASCAGAPVAGCSPAAKSLLKIKDPGTPGKGKLVWKWLKGTATKSEFGNPTASTSYALCVHVDGVQVFEAVVGAMTDWADLPSGYKFNNPAGGSDGVTKLLLKEGMSKAKILLKAKGVNFTPPALPLSAGTDVTVQLVKNPGSGAECWEQVFTPPFLRDVTTQFKDKEP